MRTLLANVNSGSRWLFAVPVRLSVVCLWARAPYSSGCNFRQYFYGIWYLGHSLTSTGNFTEIVLGEPLHRELNTRGVVKYSDFGPIEAISRKRRKIRGKLLLITNRKSHMSFLLVPKSVTLNDLERRSGRYFRYFSEIGSIRGALRKSG